MQRLQLCSMFKALAVVTILLASLLAVSADTRAGRASTYSANFRKAKNNACRVSSKNIDRRYKSMYAALSSADFDKKETCGKCVLIKGTASSNSRRFVPGTYALIVDSSKEISSGELLLSEKALKASTRSSDDKVVGWEIVDCPPSSNLRGSRKLMDASQA
jgi:hypothetical protein